MVFHNCKYLVNGWNFGGHEKYYREEGFMSVKKYLHGRRHIRARKTVAEGRRKRQYVKLVKTVALFERAFPSIMNNVIDILGNMLSAMGRMIEAMRNMSDERVVEILGEEKAKIFRERFGYGSSL